MLVSETRRDRPIRNPPSASDCRVKMPQFVQAARRLVTREFFGNSSTLNGRHPKFETRETEVDTQRRGERNCVRVWRHWERDGGASGQARSAIGIIPLVVRVAISDSEGGSGTRLNHDQLRWHVSEKLTTAVSYFDRLTLI